MRSIDTVVIGGGQAGLAMSRCLSDRSVEHVVLERGRVAERWRSERWDSLRLLTPNWQTRLPGFRYQGPDPDGFMGMPELVSFFERYAASCATPLESGVSVTGVDTDPGGFRVETSRGAWLARHVVIATGYSDVPYVPASASRLPASVTQVVPSHYRNPDQLPLGGVLVVGASATGIQLAEEIHASGRPVTLAVGRHLRLPRTYRGRDILWWFDAMGIFDAPVENVFDIRVSRSQPSLQLVGRADRHSLDISTLEAQGVRLVGRLTGVRGAAAAFDDEIVATSAASDVKLADLLGRIDAFIVQMRIEAEVAPSPPFVPTWPVAFGISPSTMQLEREGIRTVVWATGFRRGYSWLHVPVLDSGGEIRQRGGVTPATGLYVLGMHFQRRRKSAFIDGVGDDARVLADRIAARQPGAVFGAQFSGSSCVNW